MSKTAGPAPGFRDKPSHTIELVPTAKRVRVSFAGKTVADTLDALVLLETNHTPVYYVPRADVATDLLVPSDRTTHCPYKGDASYYTLRADGREAESAVWAYERPFDEMAAIKDRVAFYWDRMDHWYEEDEEVFVHPRSPHVRIDILASARPVKVAIAGETVAQSSRGRFLFETGLPPRYYLPRADVTAELVESDTVTRCPYKGTARYYSVRVGDEIREDIVWYYPDPLPEVAGIGDRLCFFNERVDALYLDGVEQAKPKTKWS